MSKQRHGLGLALMIWLVAAAAADARVISSSNGQVRWPHMAIGDGVLHVVDIEGLNLVYYRSADGGASFSPARTIANLARDMNPEIAATHNFVYIVWRSDVNPGGAFETYFIRSVDGGLNFEAPQLLSANDRKNSFASSVGTSTSGSRVVACYWDLRVINGLAHSNIFTRTSNSFGAAGSWGPETVANDPAQFLDFDNPVVKVLPNGRISMLLQSDPNAYPQGGLLPRDIQHLLSADGGVSYFREPTFVSVPYPLTFADKTNVDSFVDPAGIIYAAWYEARFGRNVFFSKSGDSGLTWTDPIQISRHTPAETLAGDQDPGRPSVVVVGQHVEVYWARTTFNTQSDDAGGPLMRAVSNNGGASFDPQTVFFAGTAAFPTAVSDGKSIYVSYSADQGSGRMGLNFDVLTNVVVPVLDWVGVVAVLAGFSWLIQSRRGGGRRRMQSVAALVVAAALSAPAMVQAQTAQAKLSDGGTVNDLYRTSSGLLLAATEGAGIYRSTDSGANWTASSTGLADLYVASLDGNRQSLVIAGTRQGIYRSADAGLTWSRRIRAMVNSVKIDPTNSLIFYAGTRAGGVLKSTDGGLTWRSPGISGMQSLEVSSVDIGGGRVWAATNGRGVHVSTNGGATWTRKMNGAEGFTDANNIHCLRVDPVNANNVYFGTLGEQSPTIAGIEQGFAYATNDAGTSWHRQPMSEPPFGVVSLSVLAGGLFIGTDQIGLFKSIGVPSTGQFAKVFQNAHVRDIEGDATGLNLWIALRGAGVFRSTNGGISFLASSHGLRSFAVTDLSANGQIVLAAVSGGILRSTNGGTSFSLVVNGLGIEGAGRAVQMIAVKSTSGGRAYASSLNNGFYVSDDDGASWIQRSPPNPNSLYAIAVGATKDHVLTGGRQGNVYTSGNGGQTWSTINVGSAQGFISSIFPNPANFAQLLVSSYNQRSFATSNGTNFVTIGQPTSANHRFPMNEVLTIPQINTQVIATLEGVMTRGASYGASPGWTRRLNGTADSNFTSVVVQPGQPSKLMAAAFGSGLYLSRDGGVNWTKLSTSFRNKAILTLEATAGAVFVGTLGDGIYSVAWP